MKVDQLPFALRDYVDGRIADCVTGSTIAGDLSFLASTLEWARHVKRIDVHPEIRARRAVA